MFNPSKYYTFFYAIMLFSLIAILQVVFHIDVIKYVNDFLSLIIK